MSQEHHTWLRFPIKICVFLADSWKLWNFHCFTSPTPRSYFTDVTSFSGRFSTVHEVWSHFSRAIRLFEEIASVWFDSSPIFSLYLPLFPLSLLISPFFAFCLSFSPFPSPFTFSSSPFFWLRLPHRLRTIEFHTFKFDKLYGRGHTTPIEMHSNEYFKLFERRSQPKASILFASNTHFPIKFCWLQFSLLSLFSDWAPLFLPANYL